ncbi:nuclear transport factor 2 family protein [Leptospira ognonensis]|uniref:Nuclear transport factor 2 family protein n=1 Tax=Leptospira ognonensis TaxID=2484945 RepID=A0A4R9K2L2_9LEPT|nr:nuclear transport factor 2 family protein [Leptospira ognonensis]TGL60249.1 nuclear transport factor 2 family protein [Leptospira ognonensis]
MINQILILLTMVVFGVAVSGLAASDESEIKDKVAQFLKAGDEQDPNSLEAILHPEYRITVAFPGEKKVTILTKETYMQMLRDKKLGGHKRSLKFEDVSIKGNVAVVRTQLQSDVMKFFTFFSFINVGDGWKMINDLPYAEKLN